MLLSKIAVWKSSKLAVCCKYSIFCGRRTTRHPKVTSLRPRPHLRLLLRRLHGPVSTLQENPPPRLLGCREYYLRNSVYVYMDFLLRHLSPHQMLGRHCKMSRRWPAGEQARGTAVNKKKHCHNEGILLVCLHMYIKIGLKWRILE